MRGQMAKKKHVEIENGPSPNVPKSDERATQDVAFHYIKSNQFRVIHGDGAAGGPSPDGEKIHFAIYSERIPIPTKVVHEVDSEGRLGKERSRESRGGIVREVEVDIVMSVRQAKILAEWLIAHVKNVEISVDSIKGDRERA